MTGYKAALVGLGSKRGCRAVFEAAKDDKTGSSARLSELGASYRSDYATDPLEPQCVFMSQDAKLQSAKDSSYLDMKNRINYERYARVWPSPQSRADSVHLSASRQAAVSLGTPCPSCSVPRSLRSLVQGVTSVVCGR